MSIFTPVPQKFMESQESSVKDYNNFHTTRFGEHIFKFDEFFDPITFIQIIYYKIPYLTNLAISVLLIALK